MHGIWRLKRQTGALRGAKLMSVLYRLQSGSDIWPEISVVPDYVGMV